MLKIKDKELAKVRKLLEDQQKINLTLIEDERKEHKYKACHPKQKYDLFRLNFSEYIGQFDNYQLYLDQNIYEI
jgi:hypothetical protein